MQGPLEKVQLQGTCAQENRRLDTIVALLLGVIGLIPDEIVVDKFVFEGSVDDWGAWPRLAFVVAFPAVLVVVHVEVKR